jgi:two-component system CheB/CheR fusion protein
VVLRGVDWAVTGDPQQLDVSVVPLSEGGVFAGMSLVLQDTTRLKRMQEEVVVAREELQALSEELESTNEELETTNEELQSANEELETTNEELQSTNEELETMNEELQSTNEELHTVNDEVRVRSDDLQHANLFLESILASLRNGVVVVDRELHVTVWNRQAEELWGLRADEVRSKHFLNLDIGLPVQALRDAMRACLGAACVPGEVVLEATNRRGKKFMCEVVLNPLGPAGGESRGVILIMRDLGRATEELREARPS